MNEAVTDSGYLFDDRAINWRAVPGMDGLVLAVLDVDGERRTVDFAVKFDPNTKVLFHRHLALTHSFVIQGDHVIYETDGSQRESRPVGTYSVTRVTDDVHSEGGGPNGCILIYSVRGERDALFELMDDQFESSGEMGIADFRGLMAA